MFRYFGSKASTSAVVAELATNGLTVRHAADAFGGLGNIGAALRARGCRVTTCDVVKFANAFQHVRIVTNATPRFRKLAAHKALTAPSIVGLLNSTSRYSSWFLHEYAWNRRFFTEENARAIGGAWLHICEWERTGLLSLGERRFLVASLLNSMDQVANTAGTYYAYLKGWHRKALKPFRFEFYPILPLPGVSGSVVYGDALESLAGKRFDLLYLDPPYNTRDYSRYYHLPETIGGLRALRIDPKSVCGQPLQRSSAGSMIRRASSLGYLVSLIGSVGWKRLVVQYADGATIPIEEMADALEQFGAVRTLDVDALAYTTKSERRATKHHIFVVDA